MLLMILKNSRIQPDKQNRTVIAASLSLFFFLIQMMKKPWNQKY